MPKNSIDVCSNYHERELICKLFVRNEAKKLSQHSSDERLDYYQDRHYSKKMKKLIEKAIQKI